MAIFNSKLLVYQRVSFSHIPCNKLLFSGPWPGHGDAGSAMGQVDEERLKRQDAEDSRTKLTSEMEALRVEEPWDPWDPSWSKSRKGRYVWKKYQHGKYVWNSFHVLSSSGWYYIYIVRSENDKDIRSIFLPYMWFFHILPLFMVKHFYPMCSMTGATTGGSDIGARRFTASARQLRAGQV